MKKRISQIAEVKSGFLFKESVSPDKDGKIRVVQLKDVNDEGILNSKELQKITLENFDSVTFLAVGDVLLKAKTNHPISALVKEVLGNTIATAHYFIIRIKTDDLLPGYLAWYLNQRPAQVYFGKKAGGTRIQVINKQVLGELEVVIPKLSIQEKIEKVYGLCQRERDIMNALKEKKQNLIAAKLLSVVVK